MQLMPLEETLAYLCCPICRQDQGRLILGDLRVSCPNCGKAFPVVHNVIDLVDRNFLDENAQNEHSENQYDLANEDVVKSITSKEHWSPVYTHSLLKGIHAASNYLSRLSPGDTLVVLGSGAGFDLKMLAKNRELHRVLASDISVTATALVPRSLALASGNLGLFACDFDHCPVTRSPTVVGLVFQALHHASDVHDTIRQLLTNNFDRLIMVEPTTNWFVEILAKFGMAKRVEYSGLHPDWIHLSKVRAIASELGYSMQSMTWWEFPKCYIPKFVDRVAILRWLACTTVDVVSFTTNFFRFGTMGIVKLEKVQEFPATPREGT